MRRENWHTCECRTLEEQEKKNADLDGKTGTSISEIEILKLKSELAYRKCEMCVGHEEHCLQIVARPIRPGADRELAATQAGNRT
jgi:hypothetical protein